MISEKTAWVVFPRSTPLDCCIIQIYMPNRTGRHTKYGILLLMLSLTMILNTIGLGLPMFIDATTSLQAANFNIFNRPLLIFACLYPPHLEKWGVQKKFFRSLRSRILFCTSHLKIRGSASAPAFFLLLNCSQQPTWILRFSYVDRILKQKSSSMGKLKTY